MTSAHCFNCEVVGSSHTTYQICTCVMCKSTCICTTNSIGFVGGCGWVVRGCLCTHKSTTISMHACACICMCCTNKDSTRCLCRWMGWLGVHVFLCMGIWWVAGVRVAYVSVYVLAWVFIGVSGDENIYSRRCVWIDGIQFC